MSDAVTLGAQLTSCVNSEAPHASWRIEAARHMAIVAVL